MSLLDKAKEQPARRIQECTSEELELILAWLGGRLGTSQVARAIGKADGAVACWVAYKIRDAYIRKEIHIRLNEV